MESIAVILAIAYLLLVIRQNIFCWVCSAVSSLIYVYLFFGVKLYVGSLLNFFYFGMAVYGWYSWSKGINETALAISSWSVKVHFLAVCKIVLLSLISGYFLSVYSDAVFPYLDSLTAFFSIWATYLVAIKVLENWWYWLVIDLFLVAVYWSRDLHATALLFVVYIILIPFGLLAWKRSYASKKI